MEIKGTHDDFDDRVRNLPAHDSEETGFMQNVAAAQTLVLNENMSFSSSLNRQMYDDRKKQVWDYIDNGTIPERVVEGYGGDIGGISRYARTELGLTDVATDDELLKERQDLIEKDRQSMMKIAGQQNKMGALGAVTGGALIALDPIYLPTYVTGISAAARGTQILAGAAKVGAIEAGIEAAKQVEVYNHKNNMGIDYSVGDAAKEIAINAVFAVGAEVGLFALSAGLKRMVSGRVIETTAEKTAVKAVNDEVIDIQNHIDNGGDPEFDAIVHWAQKERIRNEADGKGPVRTVDPSGEPELPNFETLRADRAAAREAVPKQYKESFDQVEAKEFPNVERDAAAAEKMEAECLKV